MRIFSLMSICLCGLLAPIANSQDEPVLKHVLIVNAQNVGHSASVAALSVVRVGEPSHSLIHLKGNVVIRVPFCVSPKKGARPVCDGYMVIHADQADFQEDTGNITNMSNATMTRLTTKTQGPDKDLL
jgi:hypothetical protein